LAKACFFALSAGIRMPKLGVCRPVAMPTLDALLHAMGKVNEEMEIHCDNLANPELDQINREVIGRYAAEGVRRGLFTIAIHQQLLAWSMDDLVIADALAAEGLVEAD